LAYRISVSVRYANYVATSRKCDRDTYIRVLPCFVLSSTELEMTGWTELNEYIYTVFMVCDISIRYFVIFVIFCSVLNWRRKISGFQCSSYFFKTAALYPGVYSRNIKIIMFLGSKVRRERRADNLTTICEPIV
jgi:hypothetical protein